MADDLYDILGPAPQRARWKHQAKEFDEFRFVRARALLWSMRTGKSRAVIEKACFQLDQATISGVIVIAPNGVHVNFSLNEIPRWSWQTDFRVFAWETSRRDEPDRIQRLDDLCAFEGPKWLCVNMEALIHPEGIKAIQRFLKACHGRVMVAISEAHHFGSPSTIRTRMARTLCRVAKFVTIETGTAILNSPLKAYSLYKMMDDNCLGPEFAGDTYKEFCAKYSEVEEIPRRYSSARRPSPRRNRVVGYKNLDDLRQRISKHSSVVLREDIGDMPDLIQIDRAILMSEAQRIAYKSMVSQHLLEISDGREVTAVDAGARIIKLQQIVNGYIKDDDGIQDVDVAAPIYTALFEEIEGTLGKVIVWCRFREDIRRCVAKLKNAKIGVLEFHGGVAMKDREPIRLAFQTDDRYKVLVGQPAAGGEGRDFSAASTIIFFSSTPNAIHYQQAQERGTQIAGKAVNIIRFRTHGTVDDRNYEILDGKIQLADTVTGTGLRDLLLRTDI